MTPDIAALIARFDSTQVEGAVVHIDEWTQLATGLADALRALAAERGEVLFEGEVTDWADIGSTDTPWVYIEGAWLAAYESGPFGPGTRVSVSRAEDTP